MHTSAMAKPKKKLRKKFHLNSTNLTQKGKDLYTQNYKIPVKEIQEDLNKWKDIFCSWNWRLNNVWMAIVSKLIYKFKLFAIKIPAAFLCRNWQAMLWNRVRPKESCKTSCRDLFFFKKSTRIVCRCVSAKENKPFTLCFLPQQAPIIS